ncbi:toprim domain-containing protein [Roseobacter sp.]|uniref:DUF7146 domain-containing protein n=1 Tax=Roseobacter sp. TaxID=1907202 RepID=UPI0029664238|nr:toprim domain-containing protein [Roseobacter sp.]MDW3181757.1 toprim domain-containing protein [Roseobacter sp.]
MQAKRQQYSLDEIKHMLLDRIQDVAYHYAPPCPTSYEDKGLYFTLCPYRPDKSVGSFYIHLSGPKRGTWRDHATGDFGDPLDLIAQVLYCNLSDALREARSYLGLQSDDPAAQRRREEAIARNKKLQAEAREKDKVNRAKRASNARRLLGSAISIEGTPAEHYLLHARGIDFDKLGRIPGSLLYHPNCYYKHTDDVTREVVKGEYPAMLARIIDRAGKTIGVHRTYLFQQPDGRWTKAPVPKAKKVLGDFGGCCIRLWSGIGPRGGKGAPLAKCPPGTRVYISEGIEDALSGAMLLPEARFLAAISLSNLGAVHLPENVSEVVLIGDRDEHAANKRALVRAGAQYRTQGRDVRLWQNAQGGKDLNDALMALQGSEGVSG